MEQKIIIAISVVVVLAIIVVIVLSHNNTKKTAAGAAGSSASGPTYTGCYNLQIPKQIGYSDSTFAADFDTWSVNDCAAGCSKMGAVGFGMSNNGCYCQKSGQDPTKYGASAKCTNGTKPAPIGVSNVIAYYKL
jgi:hypothetical protein